MYSYDKTLIIAKDNTRRILFMIFSAVAELPPPPCTPHHVAPPPLLTHDNDIMDGRRVKGGNSAANINKQALWQRSCADSVASMRTMFCMVTWENQRCCLPGKIKLLPPGMTPSTGKHASGATRARKTAYRVRLIHLTNDIRQVLAAYALLLCFSAHRAWAAIANALYRTPAAACQRHRAATHAALGGGGAGTRKLSIKRRWAPARCKRSSRCSCVKPLYQGRVYMAQKPYILKPRYAWRLRISFGTQLQSPFS